MREPVPPARARSARESAVPAPAKARDLPVGVLQQAAARDDLLGDELADIAAVPLARSIQERGDAVESLAVRGPAGGERIRFADYLLEYQDREVDRSSSSCRRSFCSKPSSVDPSPRWTASTGSGSVTDIG